MVVSMTAWRVFFRPTSSAGGKTDSDLLFQWSSGTASVAVGTALLQPLHPMLPQAQPRWPSLCMCWTTPGLSLGDPACSLGHQGVTRVLGTAHAEHSTRVTLAWGSLPKKAHQHHPWAPHTFSHISTTLPPCTIFAYTLFATLLYFICFLSSQSSPEEASTPWGLPGGEGKPIFSGWGWQSWMG